LKRITLRIIGKVRNSVRKMKREGWESVVSDVIIDPKLEEALEGIEDYSHLVVLFWLSRVQKGQRILKKIHPKSRKDLPLVGIFATRTQYRPNPIGLTVVKLIWRKKNILRMRGLDAMHGTPVIDIKPISPLQEFLKEPRVPKWYDQLWKGSKGSKR
jgi:tRNA-Thr(GGU) m(6)t(6)A37 methyltransferase TsaA